MDHWFYAWHRLKNQTEEREARPGTDYELVCRFIDSVLNCNTTHGDGKFSRLANFAKSMHEVYELYRTHWHDDNELLTAFFMGVGVAFESVSRIAEKIKGG